MVRNPDRSREHLLPPECYGAAAVLALAAAGGALHMIRNGGREAGSSSPDHRRTPIITSGKDQPSSERRGIERGAPSGDNNPPLRHSQ